MRTIADIKNDIKENEIKLGYAHKAYDEAVALWIETRLSAHDERAKSQSWNIDFYNRKIDELKAELAEALGE